MVGDTSDVPELAALQTERELLEEVNRLRIRAARRRGKVRLSLQDLATITGVPRSSLANYLSGRTLMPADVLDRVILALGVEPSKARAWAAAWERVSADRLGVRPGAGQDADPQEGEHSAPTAVSPLSTAGTMGPRKASAPRLLPPLPQRFVGRTDELREAVRRLRGPDGQPEILVVTGLPGVGKTSFAVRVGYAVAEDFPDGQLHVNLRGFDPAGTAMAPTEALRILLEALGVPSERIPESLPAQIALYRSRLADQRILVVLDNVRDDDHVRPLLPGSSSCGVIVTSRSQLPGLIVAEGAHPLTLDVLSSAEAHDLLVRRLGPERISAEPRAVGEIINRCARLPLALSIVAARAAIHPTFTLRALADELHDAGDGLDALAGGDTPTNVRAAFSWSYRTLSAGAARLFRLLGVPFGTDISVPATASLAGVSIGQARPALAELTRNHLIIEHVPGRYTLHDLMRTYAGELASADTGGEQHAALHRLLDHYLHTAYTAERLLGPHRDPIKLAPAYAGVAPDRITDDRQALAWFNTEHPALLAAVGTADAAGLDIHTWQLAWTLTTFLHRRGRWHDLATSQLAACDAAARLGDRSAQAQAHRELAIALTQVGDYDQAQGHLQRALALYRELGDDVGRAHTHLNLGWTCECQGLQSEALHHDRRALELFSAAGHKSGQARALNAVGWDYARLGHHRAAIGYCRQALSLNQALGHSAGEARAWDSLGYAHHHLGQYEQAVTCYERSLERYQQGEDRYGEAETLIHLGDTHHASGLIGAARHAWERALDILDDLGHSEAEQVRARLDRITKPTGSRPGSKRAAVRGP